MGHQYAEASQTYNWDWLRLTGNVGRDDFLKKKKKKIRGMCDNMGINVEGYDKSLS